MSGVPTAVRPAYIEFRAYAPLDFGESLVVVGSTLVLGKHRHENGTALTTSTSTYPVWEVEKPVPVFPREDITYRYAIFSGGKFSRWEDGDLRKVVVKPDELPPLPDGSPSRTLAVSDLVSTPGLLEWGPTEAADLANGDNSLDAVVAASLEFKERGDAEPPRATRDPGEKPFEALFSSDGVTYLSASERNTEFDLAAEAARLRDAEKERKERKKGRAAASAAAAAKEGNRQGHVASRPQEQPTRPPSPRSAARRTTASAALQAFLEEEARPPGVESAPLTEADGVVVASLFLPVLVTRLRHPGTPTEWAVEWDLENLLALQAPLRVTRVGLARVPDDTTASERAALATTLRRAPWSCIAIFIDRETYNAFYHTFCKGVLWPVFHNSLEVYGEKATPSLEFDDAPFVSADGDVDADDVAKFWGDDDDDDESVGKKKRDKGGQTTHAPGKILEAVSSAHDLDAAVRKHQSMETFSDMGEDDDRPPLLSLRPEEDELEHHRTQQQQQTPYDDQDRDDRRDDDDRDARGNDAASSSSPTTTTTTKRQRPRPGLITLEVDPMLTPPSLSPVETPSGKLATARKRTTKIDKAWRAYKRVNQIFREKVVEAYNEGDLIWIHGFQLALLPAFVSRRLTVAKVGLFLHTPFPSSEIFRTLSMRVEFLRGMLSADQVGFHLYEYARHFLTTARRLLGVRHTYDARGPVINVDGRDVVISCMHAGVEPADLADVATTEAGVNAVRKLRAELGLQADDDPTHFSAEDVAGKQQTRVIAGIDKLERLRGLPLKLLAYERFLDARAKRRDDLQKALRDREEEEEETGGEDDEEVATRGGEEEEEEGGAAREEEKQGKKDQEEEDADKDDDPEEKKKKKKPRICARYQDDVRVVLVQYALSSFERDDDCERTRRDSMILCERIRAKHGEDCLVWREVSGLPIVDRLALLKIADVFWVSSVRDGLNRWPLEYVAMQSDNLLGVERHCVGLAREKDGGLLGDAGPGLSSSSTSDVKRDHLFLAGKCSEAPADVAGPYFDDLIRRMTNACDGHGYPGEDPCTAFKPKMSLYVRQRRRRVERRNGEPKKAVLAMTDAELDAAADLAAQRDYELIKGLPKEVEDDAFEDEDELFDDFEDLADETFPSGEAVDEDQRFAEAAERRATNFDGDALVPCSHDDKDDDDFYDKDPAAKERGGDDDDDPTVGKAAAGKPVFDYYADAHDYMVDAKGQKFVVSDLTRRALGRRSRRILRRYLASGLEATRQHAARHARCRSRRLGALLLSENASSARVLLGAVAANPWRIDESAETLDAVIGMKSRERMARHALDADFLARCTTAKWAYRVLADLKAMRKDANRLNATHAGLGLNFRVIGMRSGFDALQVERVAKAYREAGRAGGTTRPSSKEKHGQRKHRSFRLGDGDRLGLGGASEHGAPAGAPTTIATRAIVLDYGGTLVPDASASTIDSVSAYAIAQGERTSPTPSPEVKQALVDLANDPRNVVFVVSGRERADLLDSLGDVLSQAPDLGLAAEHGFFVRWPRALRHYGGGGGRPGAAYATRRPSRSHDDIDLGALSPGGGGGDSSLEQQQRSSTTTHGASSPDDPAGSSPAVGEGAGASSPAVGEGAAGASSSPSVVEGAAASSSSRSRSLSSDFATERAAFAAAATAALDLSEAAPPGGSLRREGVDESDWERPFAALSDERHLPWRDAVLTTMDMFAQRTQGTYIEKHESSLVWQYRDADPDYGEMQAKELENQLADALAPFPTKPQILRGENPSSGGYLEVRPAGVDKGALLNRLLLALSAAGRPADFAMVVGDDESDEPMFRALSSWTKDRDLHAYSVCIGKKPSEANNYVDSHDSLLEILQALARVSTRGARFYSSADLPATFEGGLVTQHPVPIDDDDDAATVAVGGQNDLSANLLHANLLHANNNNNNNNGNAATQSADLTSSFLRGVRSLSMPVMAQPEPRRQTPAGSRTPSWRSFNEAARDDAIAEEQEEEEDDAAAAMFFEDTPTKDPPEELNIRPKADLDPSLRPSSSKKLAPEGRQSQSQS
eukprot:CAMPEP_0118910054 /NCGR_PEP_ID=MMETSP1166-20130328/12361_1 /TAXON_ID=1104430 /ORGANISM="Chrysoreinhardia sp, Strain CCMP3193" /LENGTH=2032 /DNA_ID=CAMNT_0006849509 /DNA_START=180 /DNA_END=6279 /DNA_ORIENTATION=+